MIHIPNPPISQLILARQKISCRAVCGVECMGTALYQPCPLLSPSNIPTLFPNLLHTLSKASLPSEQKNIPLIITKIIALKTQALFRTRTHKISLF
jgi:hypothetical protein